MTYMWVIVRKGGEEGEGHCGGVGVSLRIWVVTSSAKGSLYI